VKKNILILCTGNSCRSIIAEALINAKMKHVQAESSGVKASGKINPNAKRVLQEKGIWKETYHSKVLESVFGHTYDLIVTVCDNARETCPVFPNKAKMVYIGFEDPDGKDYASFVETYHKIESILLPEIDAMLKKI